MSVRNTSIAYGSVHRALHWLVALLVIPQLIIGDVMLFMTPQVVPTLTSYVHPTVGILIGLLMVARLYWRQSNVLPTEPKDIGVAGETLSALTHYAFYCLLIINPVVGYLLACAAKNHVYFGFIWLPHVIGGSPNREFLFFWLHLVIGVSIGLLVLLHIAGALNHEFLLKDNVLRRMLGFPSMTGARQERQDHWPDGSPAAALEETARHSREV